MKVEILNQQIGFVSSTIIMVFAELKNKSSSGEDHDSEVSEHSSATSATTTTRASPSWSKHCMTGITLCFKVE